MTCWAWCRRGDICEHPLTVHVWRTTEDGGTIAARGRSQPSCLTRHVVVRCPSPGTCPILVDGCHSSGLLVSERLNRVEACSLPGRVDAEDDTDHTRKTHGYHECVSADQGGPGGDRGDAVCAHQPKPQP
jgi:hypothetical protein